MFQLFSSIRNLAPTPHIRDCLQMVDTVKRFHMSGKFPNEILHDIRCFDALEELKIEKYTGDLLSIGFDGNHPFYSMKSLKKLDLAIHVNSISDEILRALIENSDELAEINVVSEDLKSKILLLLQTLQKPNVKIYFKGVEIINNPSP